MRFDLLCFSAESSRTRRLHHAACFSAKRISHGCETLKVSILVRCQGERDLGDGGRTPDMVILNGRLVWQGVGHRAQGGPTACRQRLRGTGLMMQSKCLHILGKEGFDNDNGGEKSATEVKCDRALAARAIYLCLDHTDIQFRAREACRRISKPTDQDWIHLKRLARCTRHVPELLGRGYLRWDGQ